MRKKTVTYQEIGRIIDELQGLRSAAITADDKAQASGGIDPYERGKSYGLSVAVNKLLHLVGTKA